MNKSLILVTGGAGYIGSHAVKTLQQKNFNVLVLDNFVYGHKRILEDVLKVPYVVGQVGDRSLLDQLLSGSHPACLGQEVSAVLHFAAYAYVGESVEDPAKYYRNNLGDSLCLLEALKAEGERRKGNPVPLVFSSTCATYGIPSSDQIPICENTPQTPINPYGQSKLMIEKIIADFSKAYDFPCVIFRYFNAAGADPEGGLGEDHNPETHLIPLIFKSITQQDSILKVFGDDYDTPDGTCIRDYIHVSDLADAHFLGLQKVLGGGGFHVYNLGNGVGYSVKQVIKAAELVTGRKVNQKNYQRRQGDPPVLVASSNKACRELGWKPAFDDIKSILTHAWKWHQKLNTNL